jgi:hypothetical protein
MKGKKSNSGGFIIDKLTNSIENVVTGDSFATETSLLTFTDHKNITQNGDWQFNWRLESKALEKDVYKLTIVGNPTIIQGLISLEVKADHVYVHLVESAPFNKGKSKMYSGVPGNLVAFAFKLSYQRGNEGHVAFISKTQLINHYKETLGAINVGGRLMIIDATAALKLIQKYFNSK